MDTKINLFLQHKQWELHPDVNPRLINRIFQLIMDSFLSLKSFKLVEASVFLSNNSYIRYLNNRYLHKNKPTNVLAFPKLELDYRDLHLSNLKIQADTLNLGEVILSYNTCLVESKKLSISLIKHCSHLLTHGFLHLLGFDHINPDDAKIMEEMEHIILAQIK